MGHTALRCAPRSGKSPDLQSVFAIGIRIIENYVKISIMDLTFSRIARPDEPYLRLLRAQQLPTEDLHGNMEFFTLHAGNALCGTGALEVRGPYALLRSVSIDDPCKGRGMGRRLVGTIEEKARASGVTRLYLLTTTAETFFERLGYKRTDRKEAPESIRQTSEFDSVCPASAVCMVKDLV